MYDRKLIGNIVTPEKVFFGDLHFGDGIITNIVERDVRRADADWILPGFIDIHLHGLGNFSADSASGVTGMAQFAPSTGITGLCPTLASYDFDKMCEFLSAVAPLVQQTPMGAARIFGTHLEGPYIEAGHKGGMNSAFLRRPDPKEVIRLLDAARGTLRLMTISPELPGAAEAIKMLLFSGVTVSAGHTGCSGAELEVAIRAGVNQICHLFDTFDGRIVENGVSVPALADLVLIDDRLNLEIIPDGIHVAPALVHLARRAAGAGRIIAITDAMKGTGLPDAVYEMTDGRPFTLKNGDAGRLVEYPECIVGSCLTMNYAFVNLTTRFGFDPVSASLLTATNPARAIHVDGTTGALKPGLAADITVLEDKECGVKKTLIGGEIVYEK